VHQGTGDPWGSTVDPALAAIAVDEVLAALDTVLSGRVEWGPAGSAQA
jgi:hypothetical protein